MRGSVYVIKTDSGLVKIGAARNVRARLSGIRCKVDRTAAVAYDTGPIDDVGTVERLAQRFLSTKVVRGEWFQADVSEAIAAIEKARSEAANNNESLSHYGRPVVNHERKKTVLSISLFEDQKEALDTLARVRKTSLAAVLREIVDMGLPK